MTTLAQDAQSTQDSPGVAEVMKSVLATIAGTVGVLTLLGIFVLLLIPAC